MEKENIFIIFSPGSGGNHLANLIGLSSRFYRQVDYSKYQSNIENAHYSKIKNLNYGDIYFNLNDLLAQNNVLCGHIGEYLFSKALLRKLPNRKYLIINLPKFKTGNAYKRMSAFNPGFNNHEYFWEEQRILYSQESLAALFQEDDFFNIDAELLFQSSKIIIDYIEQTLHTELDRQTATEIHDLWLSKNKPE